jgi:glycerophosphoryl diester phosphodiesterase
MTSVVGLAAYAGEDSRYFGGRHNEYHDGHGFYGDHGQKMQDETVQLGSRPFYLVDGMDEGKLKDRLKKCKDGPFYRADFSIGHRGAALQFPEHTKESYQAGARMGAGIVECDVTFTKDGELVCRHAECDLHTTTNIVTTPLYAKRCAMDRTGFESGCASDDARRIQDAKGQDGCEQFRGNDGRISGGTASRRTDLYTGAVPCSRSGKNRTQ